MTRSGPATSASTTAPAVAERPRTDRRPWFVIGLELFISASAIYGGVGLIWNNVLGMPDDWLQGTPFTSWTLPGIFLLLVVAVPMAGAAVLELRRSPMAPVASSLLYTSPNTRDRG
jgi:hypothetical protein